MTTGNALGADLSRLGRGLAKDAMGIWHARVEHGHQVSFPADGHTACFEIEDGSFWFSHRNACIVATLARAQFRGPLLDIGGGNGCVSQALERNHIETILLEPGLEGARNARRRGLRNVVCATLEEACFEPESFGAAGLFDVAEHVADDDALLREVQRILRPGGLLCLTVPAYAWLWSEEDEVAGHHRRYTLRRVRELLSRHAFRTQYQSYFFAPLTPAVLLARSLPHRVRHRSAADVARDAARQHLPSPLLRRAIDALLAPELRWIAAGRSIPLGTSCLAVAVRS